MPGILVAVVGVTVIVGTFDLAARYGVAVLGPLPQGLPGFAVPWISSADIVPVLIGGCAIALVSFADTSVLSRAYAARTATHVDPNQEMVGLGAANLAAGFFQGFPISSSSSRTPVAEAAGARTQLTSVVAALIIALLLLTAPNLLQNLPKTALAAVVIASAIGLIEVADLKRIYRIQPWEFWLSIICSVGVAVLGAIPGIGLAIAIAIIQFLWDGWRPHSAVLGRAQGVKGYHDITRYPDARRIPGWSCFGGMRLCFSPTPNCSRARAGRGGEVANSGTVVGRRCGACHRHRRHRRRYGRGVEQCVARDGHRAVLCRAQGSRKGQAQEVRTVRTAWRALLLSEIGVAVSRYLKLHDVDWLDWEDQS